MSVTGMVVRAVVVAACAVGLQACAGKYGPHGDAGLPPPPENLSYPNVYETKPDNHNRLKTEAEQKKLQADLLARKPPPGSKRGRRYY